jgi:serine/threonine protein kinase
MDRRFQGDSGQSGQMEIERGSADFTMEAGSKTGEKLDGPYLLDILKQLVSALEYAHKNGSTHKNIRPENIRFREDGTPTLVDLFISNVLGPDYREPLLAKGITFGSVYYESPEQALKKPPDSKSDVYSLGVVFYEMLTGQVPYIAAEPVAIENQHIMEPVPQLPDHLKIYQPLLEQMMNKEKDARIPAGIELVQLIDELTRQVPGETIKQPAAPKMPTEQPLPPPMPQQEDPAIPFEPAKPLEPVEPMKPPAPPEPMEPPEPMAPPEPVEPPEPVRPMRPMEPSIEDERGIQKIGKKVSSSPSILSNPRTLIAIVGGIVVIVLLVVLVIKPFSSGEEGSTQTRDQAGQTRQKPLTEEERMELQRKERQFKHKLGLAKSLLQKGQIQKAVDKLDEAETFLTTPKSKQLLEDAKLMVLKKKDDEAFKQALSAGTILALEDYLKKYPSGVHANEANQALNRLQEEEKQKEAERQRILDNMTKLRHQYQELSVDDVKAMLKDRGFFDKYYNKTGDFQNHFEGRTIKQGKIVVDFATGLIWHQFGSESYMNIERVKPWLEDLNKQEYAGYSDWRLPTLEEAASLLESKESRFGLYIDEVFASEQRFIWTGDTVGKDKGWVIDFYSGDISNVPLTTMVFVRPVRTLKEFTP